MFPLSLKKKKENKYLTLKCDNSFFLQVSDLSLAALFIHKVALKMTTQVWLSFKPILSLCFSFFLILPMEKKKKSNTHILKN